MDDRVHNYEAGKDISCEYSPADIHSQLFDDVFVTYKQEIESILRITAEEERRLGKDILKLQHICYLSNCECVINNTSLSYLDIMLNAMTETSDAHTLVEFVKSYTGLNKLGDVLVENMSGKAQMTDVFRLVLERSQKEKSDESCLYTEDNDCEKPCCLKDLFGFIFREAMDNIAFGSGNPELVDSISKKMRCEQSDSERELMRLAINVELIPSNLLGIVDGDLPLKELADMGNEPVFIQKLKRELPTYELKINTIKTNGEKALRRLIESHLWLVINIAKKYDNQGVSLSDLIQEGNIGLMMAAERYNPKARTRFMQYGTSWIYQKIQRAIADQARTIRVPVHMTVNMDRLLTISELLGHKLGREPTREEIGHEMGISTTTVEQIQSLFQWQISLESLASEEDDTYLGDFIEDQSTIPPVEAASLNLLKDQVEEVLSTLTPRERRVLQLRFGMEDGRSRTLEEVGEVFGVTRERIRQIEEKAFRRLRHPSRSKKLKDYLE